MYESNTLFKKKAKKHHNVQKLFFYSLLEKTKSSFRHNMALSLDHKLKGFSDTEIWRGKERF